MKVVAFDPFLSEEQAEELGVEKLTLDELLARVDVITMHTPLTDGSRRIVDAATFAKCKRRVRLVNGAHGELVDEAVLKAAIESGQVAGAALDVFAKEPARDNPLFEAPKPRHYMELARQFGSFAVRPTRSSLEAVRIEYEGQAADLNTCPSTAVALACLVGPLLLGDLRRQRPNLRRRPMLTIPNSSII